MCAEGRFFFSWCFYIFSGVGGCFARVFLSVFWGRRIFCIGFCAYFSPGGSADSFARVFTFFFGVGGFVCISFCVYVLFQRGSADSLA